MASKGIVTSVDPYKLLSSVQYYSGNRYTVYKKLNTIKVVPNELSKGKEIHKQLFASLKRDYPNSTFISTVDGNIGKIRVTSNGSGSVHIILPKSSNPSVLRPGEAYELYFQSVLLDGIKHTKELQESISDLPYFIKERYSNLSLVVSAGRKKMSVGNIKSSDKVGQLNKKPDVMITRYNGPAVKVSLKQSNFFSWSSADTYNPRFSPRVKNIIEDAISNGKISLGPNKEIIFPPGISGIRIPATAEEIKYYVFGDGNDRVDYVVVHAILQNYDHDNRVINMTASNIYKHNSSSDLTELMSDVFLVIYSSKSSPSALNKEYKNVSIRYANRSHAYNAIDRSKYMDI